MDELLTQGEVIKMLRLDSLGLKRPDESLRYMRRTGQIGYVRVNGKIMHRTSDVQAYIERNQKDARR